MPVMSPQDFFGKPVAAPTTRTGRSEGIPETPLSRLFDETFPGVRITSTYRSREHNRRTPGAVANSYHTRGHGQAIDAYPESAEQLAAIEAWARENQHEVIKYRDGRIHVEPAPGGTPYEERIATQDEEDTSNAVAGMADVPADVQTPPTGPRTASAEDFFGAPTTAAPAKKGFLETVAEGVVDPATYAPLADAATRTWEQFKRNLDPATRQRDMVSREIARYSQPTINQMPNPLYGKPVPQHLLEAQSAYEEQDRIARADAQDNGPAPREIVPGEFIANLENPLKLLTEDSIPANVAEFFAGQPQRLTENLQRARQVMQQERILANPQQFPDVAIQAALQARSARLGKVDPTVAQQWEQLKAAAFADPRAVGAQFVNAILADPEMLLVPGGIGLRPIEGTRKLATGVQATNRVVRGVDQAVDAGVLGAGLNVAASAADQASRGVYSAEETKLAAGLGAVLGVATGGIFGLLSKGKAPATPVEKAKFDAAVEETLAGRPVADAPAHRTPEEAAAYAERIKTAQQQLREFYGIRSKEELDAWKRKRRADVRAAFKDDAAYADYLEALDAERVAAAERQAAAPRQALEESPGAEIASPQTALPDAGSPAVLEAIDTPAFLRTAEQRVLLQKAFGDNPPDPSQGAPDNAAVIAALKKEPFQRTAEERVLIEKSPLGKSGYKPGTGPKGQQGFIDQKLLARGAVAGTAAAVGYGLAGEEGAWLGGLAGLAVPAGGRFAKGSGSNVLSILRQAGAISPDGLFVHQLVPDNLRLPDEAKIIERAKAGDSLAQKKIYEQYSRSVAKFVRPYLREAGPKLGIDPDDIVQDTFMEVFTHLDSFKGTSEFTTWVKAIAKNTALNAIKKAGRRVDTETMFNKSRGESTPSALTGTVVKEGDNALLRPDVEAAAASLDSPENLAIAEDAARIIEQAFKALPEKQQQAMRLKHEEGLGQAEIAESLKITANEAGVLLNRAETRVKELLAKGFGAKKPTGPRSQRGEIDPRLLKAGAVAGVGALIGAGLNEDHPLAGAVVGAGLTLGARSVRKPAIQGLDTIGGAVSTRIKNISEALHHRVITLERKLLSETQIRLDRVDPFLVKLNKLPEGIRDLVNRAILTNDPEVTNNLLKQHGDSVLLNNWKEVRSVLDSLRDKLIDLGRFKEGISEYFPRIVKDYEGLLEALGKTEREYLDRIVKKADEEKIKATGQGLNDIERSIIINKAMQANAKPGGQPGFAKNRVIEDISPELQKYYATPTESLHSYIRSAVQDIEMAKFFGKDLKNVVKNGRTYTNVDGSIGELVLRLQREGKITANQAMEVSSLLKSRFTGGMRGANEVVQGMKDLANAGLLGNVASAVTQLGDTLMQGYLQDIGSAIKAAAQSLTGQHKFKMESFGLATHIAEEFVSTTKTAKFLQKSLKFGAFSAIDRFGKNVALNAALIRHSKLAKTPKGIEEIRRKYGEALGNDFDELINDLKDGKDTDLTRGLAFAELSRSQPVSRIELPQAYLDNPNGRVLYMLKTFMLKQIDLARRDGYNEIKKGNHAKGVKNLMELGIALGLSGTATATVKDFLMGRDVDLQASDIPMNMLKTFGLSEYFLKTATGGEGKARPLDAVRDAVLPPYRMMQEIIRADPKAMRYIPLIGWLFARGDKKDAESLDFNTDDYDPEN